MCLGLDDQTWLTPSSSSLQQQKEASARQIVKRGTKSDPSGMSKIKMIPEQPRRHSSNKKLRTKSITAKRFKDVGKQKKPTTTKKNAQAVLTITQALKKNFFLDHVPEDTLNQLVDAFEDTLSFRAGEVIIHQGDIGDYFYVIESGQVSFEVDGNFIGSATEGTSFGELALLYSCPRAAMAKATVETSLWRLDQESFCYVLHSQSKASKGAKKQLLKNISFFQAMAPSDIKQCVKVMVPYKFEAGEVIVKKGEVGNAFYVIESGEVLVKDISVGDTTYDDVTLGPRAFFGERGIIKSEPRAANVVGVKAGTLFSIDRHTFERVCGSLVRLILKCQDQQRLSNLKAIKAANLAAHDLSELTRFIVDEVYPEGKTIFAENAKTTPALYLVREGQITIKDQSGKERIVKEGEYFGEDHLWADAKRLVQRGGTVVAPYTVTVVDQDAICGVLSLRDCRKIFDTKSIGSFEDSFAAPEEKEEESDDMTSFVPRMSIDVNVLEKNLRHETLLGEGQFGAVWRVTVVGMSDDTEYALKMLSKDNPDIAEDAIKRECQILGSIRHPFVVELVHTYEDVDNFYMVMRLIKGGDLWAVIHRELDNGDYESGIPEDHAKFYLAVIFDTLAYLHDHLLLAFRDLKPENIMIDEDGYPIIVDFGFAKILKDGVTYTLCGTPQYIAPEIIKNSGHDFGVDHWAAGIMLYEMIAGENPFYYEGIDNIALFSDICKQPPYPLAEDNPASDAVCDLIDFLLEKDPTQRIGSMARGSREIAEHPWFDDIDLFAARNRSLKAPSRS